LYKKKYKPGRKIKSLSTLLKYLKKNKFIYHRGKIYHEGWVLSWQFRYVTSCVNGGHFKKAIKINQKES
jgi:hypothetical protein